MAEKKIDTKERPKVRKVPVSDKRRFTHRALKRTLFGFRRYDFLP